MNEELNQNDDKGNDSKIEVLAPVFGVLGLVILGTCLGLIFRNFVPMKKRQEGGNTKKRTEISTTIWMNDLGDYDILAQSLSRLVQEGQAPTVDEFAQLERLDRKDHLRKLSDKVGKTFKSLNRYELVAVLVIGLTPIELRIGLSKHNSACPLLPYYSSHIII